MMWFLEKWLQLGAMLLLLVTNIILISIPISVIVGILYVVKNYILPLV